MWSASSTSSDFIGEVVVLRLSLRRFGDGEENVSSISGVVVAVVLVA